MVDSALRWLGGRIGLLVWLIALHSVAVAVGLTLFPTWALGVAGWEGGASPLFFPRQAGIFHLVVALGYLGEWRTYGGVRLLVMTKTLACLFLGAAWLAGENAWSVPFSALTDGLMGLVVALARHTGSSNRSAASAAPDCS